MAKYITNKNIYIIGIKGSGCTALAEVLHRQGNTVSGSDIDEKFYTDAILTDTGISYHEQFAADNIPESTDIVIYSAAYNESNPEFAAARQRSIPMYSYPQALGLLSQSYPQSAAIAGVHGKTTTTALAGALVKELGLPYSLLAGSAVSVFDNKSTYHGGDEAFIAETCEYRRHFLNFHPSFVVITSVETDHQDYFKDYDDIEQAFIELACRLPAGGTLIYCADDEGAVNVARKTAVKRPDIRQVAYGFGAGGAFKINNAAVHNEQLFFNLSCFGDESLHFNMPGEHLVRDAAAALALLDAMGAKLNYDDVKNAFSHFSGSRRRSEIVLRTADNILVMDDYAHHPTAIKTTLAGLRAFYPDRRFIVSFMSHTYSRTAAMLDAFAQSFSEADTLLLHRIFASAREQHSGAVTGVTLYEKVRLLHNDVHYFEEPLEALPWLEAHLKPNDLFITMGAGDNFILSYKLAELLKKRKN
jgi:UDP-N-acetylmuramate--alanine ligase